MGAARPHAHTLALLSSGVAAGSAASHQPCYRAPGLGGEWGFRQGSVYKSACLGPQVAATYACLEMTETYSPPPALPHFPCCPQFCDYVAKVRHATKPGAQARLPRNELLWGVGQLQSFFPFLWYACRATC